MGSRESTVRNVVSNSSWFRDTPHYWAEASLPLAYAVACVEVVYKSSEKAMLCQGHSSQNEWLGNLFDYKGEVTIRYFVQY